MKKGKKPLKSGFFSIGFRFSVFDFLDGMAGAFLYADFAPDALFIVDDGQVVDHRDGAFGTVFRAQAATDAADLAEVFGLFAAAVV